VSKAYKGKACVYCGVDGSSTTGDHVVAREFFPKADRANLPKVPACVTCNSDKSKLEHYLTAVLPFGANHIGALENLTGQIPSRLAKNRKLHRDLSCGLRIGSAQITDSSHHSEMSLPFDGEAMERLLKLIAQGLCAFHWGLILPPSQFDINGGFLIPEGEEWLENMLSLNAANRVSASLGNGVFEYEGVQAFDRPEITIWRMSFYRAQIGGDDDLRSVRTSKAYVCTAKRGFALPINS
jgi:hypothetical protein